MITGNKIIIYPLRNTLDCRPLQHCITRKNCDILNKCHTQIHNNDGLLIVQLAQQVKLTSECDDRTFSLTGNYFVKYHNCTIYINNKTFENTINEVKNTYVIQYFINNTNVDTLKFGEIIINHTQNIQTIKGLSISSISTILLIIIIIVFT